VPTYTHRPLCRPSDCSNPSLYSPFTRRISSPPRSFRRSVCDTSDHLPVRHHSPVTVQPEIFKNFQTSPFRKDDLSKGICVGRTAYPEIKSPWPASPSLDSPHSTPRKPNCRPWKILNFSLSLASQLSRTSCALSDVLLLCDPQFVRLLHQLFSGLILHTSVSQPCEIILIICLPSLRICCGRMCVLTCVLSQTP